MLLFGFMLKPWTAFWNDRDLAEPEDAAPYTRRENWTSRTRLPQTARWDKLIGDTVSKMTAPEKEILVARATGKVSKAEEILLPAAWREASALTSTGP